jgi:hypothetical protein
LSPLGDGSLACNISANSSNADICDDELSGAFINREKSQHQLETNKKDGIWSIYNRNYYFI